MTRRMIAAAITALATTITAACVRAQSLGESSAAYWPNGSPTPGATRPPTATPRPGYSGLVTRLLVPLGAMIVSARDHTATGVIHYHSFTESAAQVRTALEGDTGPQAVVIRAAISNIHEAWPLRDVPALERERRRLLDIR